MTTPGKALRSGTEPRIVDAGFRRILLIANEPNRLPDAFTMASALLDPLEGEVIVLEGKAGDVAAASAIRANQTTEADTLAIRQLSHGAASINEIVRQYSCDLVILMVRRQTASKRALDGCPEEQIFRHVSCPVVVIGPKANSCRSAGVINGPVICSTTFRERNIAAIGLASKIAGLCSTSLECVHVLPSDMAEASHGCHVVPEIMRNALMADARKNKVTLTAEQCHILFGSSVSKAVAGYAELRRAQFVVFGIQQGGPLASHLPAGITSSALALAPCPVVVLASRES